jgi:hypothetical protein
VLKSCGPVADHRFVGHASHLQKASFSPTTAADFLAIELSTISPSSHFYE